MSECLQPPPPRVELQGDQAIKYFSRYLHLGIKDGKEKTHYLTVGSVIESPRGRADKLDSIPAAGFDGWLYEGGLESNKAPSNVENYRKLYK